MIFVTTGTSKLPFERFVREVDRLAGALELAERVVVAMPRQSSFQELEGLTRRPDRGACD